MVTQRTSRVSEPNRLPAADTPAGPSDFPLRVEQALKYVPRLEALGPLRTFFFAASEFDARTQWASSRPYLTVGKRTLKLDVLTRRVPQVVQAVGDHLVDLYGAVLEALECDRRGDEAGAVRAVLRGGEREERAGRFAEACAWYELALGLAEELRERSPEVDALRHLGYLSTALGRYDDAGRTYQRAFVLAEAGQDTAATIIACQGLGNVALAQGAWTGAESWYGRGLSLAEAAEDRLRTAQLQHNLSIVARRTGELGAAARRLQEARRILEELGDGLELARILNSQGLWEVELGRPTEALAAYQEALAAIERAGGEPRLETTVHLNLAQYFIETTRFLEAEDEIRRAEEIVLAHGLSHRLAEVYVVMGKLRSQQQDEYAFVFFEKAIEFSGEAHSPLVAAQVYYEYGIFRGRQGHVAEARVHLERALEVLESLGSVTEVQQVREELERLRR